MLQNITSAQEYTHPLMTLERSLFKSGELSFRKKVNIANTYVLINEKG